MFDLSEVSVSNLYACDTYYFLERHVFSVNTANGVAIMLHYRISKAKSFLDSVARIRV